MARFCRVNHKRCPLSSWPKISPTSSFVSLLSVRMWKDNTTQESSKPWRWYLIKGTWNKKTASFLAPCALLLSHLSSSAMCNWILFFQNYVATESLFYIGRKAMWRPFRKWNVGKGLGGMVLQSSLLLTSSIPHIFRVFSLTCDFLVVGTLKPIFPLLWESN